MNSWLYTVIVLQFTLTANCMENNVCPTFEDYYTIKNNSKCWYDFTADSSVVEIIRKHGYPVETHKVITPDGYVLTMFRIPNYYTENYVQRREPIFLQHGWLNSCAIFVARGRDSLAFTLADAGYDVWLGNFRGSQYSEEHVNFTVSDNQYWDYSADEIGLFDIPSQLELVAQRTGQRGNIIYVGHSLGTTAALIYGSSYPKLAAETVKLFVLLAPAANLSHMRSLLFRLFGRLFGLILDVSNVFVLKTSSGQLHPGRGVFYFACKTSPTPDEVNLTTENYLNNLYKRLANNFQFIRLISHSQPMRVFVRTICLESPVLMKLCTQAMNLLVNGPRTQIEPNMVPIVFNQVPAGTSFKVTKQIADFRFNSFGRYNYGLRNLQKYGSIFPPKYDVSKIEVPVFIMYAINDWACTKEDSLNLYNKLSPKVRYGIHEILDPNFNHLDFCYGKNIRALVNDPILRLLIPNQVNLV